jgi:homoserine O-acetyltransferase
MRKRHAMNSDHFSSSDSLRSAARSEHARVVRLPEPLSLESGDVLPVVEVAFETYGTLNADRSNAVLVCHALSGDSHVARHDEHDLPGWWDIVVGPGKPIDTSRFYVICSNILGGCRGTTGPNSINPSTGKPYGASFPLITMRDMVAVQARLIDHLGIHRLHAIVGGSLGGHQALTWAVDHPDRVSNVALIATSPRLTSQALAFDVVARNAILRDPHFHDGDYYDKPTGPVVGLALARMLGHITYLSRDAMTAKFDATRLQPRDIDTAFEKLFSVGSYLAYQGKRFVERFDANSYVTLSRAMDLFDLGHDVETLRRRFASTTCRWLLLSFTSDWLFPASQTQLMADALVQAGKDVTHCNVRSDAGHDAFLLDDSLDTYGEFIRSFLEPDGIASTPQATPPAWRRDTHILHAHRLDHDLLLELIDDGQSVLDLGCGDGSLLEMIRERKSPRRLLGIEHDQSLVLATARRGIPVIQRDLELPLDHLPDLSFDVVLLSQTLQSIGNTEAVLREVLRVGRRGIVSFPNFAYRKLREDYLARGRAPKASGFYGYEWHNTPNRRFPSILDMKDFCDERDIRVIEEIYLDTEADQRVFDDPNLNADVAIFVLGRD